MFVNYDICVTKINMFEPERVLKFALKRCQYLCWEVYELIPEGIVSIADTCNAGMTVPSSCHGYSSIVTKCTRLSTKIFCMGGSK